MYYQKDSECFFNEVAMILQCPKSLTIIKKVILFAAFKQHLLQPLAPNLGFLTLGVLFSFSVQLCSVFGLLFILPIITATILAGKATPMHSQVFTLAPSPLEEVDSDVSYTCELAAQS